METRLKFRYTNWRGEEHRYEIEPRSIEFMPDMQATPETVYAGGKWVLHGHVMKRDGEPREGEPHRTFVLEDIEDLVEVEP